MVAFSAEYAPTTEAPDAKNRARKYFLATPETRRGDRLRARHPRREKPDTATKTASGMSYYGFRFYSPSQGRFLNRDPMGEQGGANLYAFVGNDPVNRWDFLGLQVSELPNNTLRQIIGRIEAHLMVGNRHDAAREAWRLYNHLATYGGLLGDKPFAADMMKHWLGNTGNLKTVARKYVKGLVQDSQVTKEFGVSIGGVVSDGGSGDVKHASGVTPVHNSDNYYAVGSFNLTFEGKYCRTGNKINLDGKWDISDDYDWHEGLSVTIRGIVIPDSYGLLVEEHNLARPYPVDGTWTGEHTVYSDGVIPESEGR